MKTNAMKKKMMAGQPAMGLSVMIPSPQLVEMAAGLGFDWVLIDMEHGTIGLESVELMAMAAEAAGITAIVRPPTKAAHHISQVMDRGAMGVQVPHVMDGPDAARAVAAVKFHPLGTRGLAAGTRPAGYDLKAGLTDYVAAANAETLVCVQVEDAEAVDKAAEIAAVPGVDVVFVGPSDLSQSMGFPGDPGAEPVARAIETVFAAAKGEGRMIGYPVNAKSLDKARQRGVLYMYTHLSVVLKRGAAGFV